MHSTRRARLWLPLALFALASLWTACGSGNTQVTDEDNPRVAEAAEAETEAAESARESGQETAAAEQPAAPNGDAPVAEEQPNGDAPVADPGVNPDAPVADDGAPTASNPDRPVAESAEAEPEAASEDARVDSGSALVEKPAEDAEPAADAEADAKPDAKKADIWASADASNGKSIFADNCVGCHGTAEKPRKGKPDLFSWSWNDKKRKHAFKDIKNGEHDMPAFKDKLSDQEIADVVAYISK